MPGSLQLNSNKSFVELGDVDCDGGLTIKVSISGTLRSFASFWSDQRSFYPRSWLLHRQASESLCVLFLRIFSILLDSHLVSQRPPHISIHQLFSSILVLQAKLPQATEMTAAGHHDLQHLLSVLAKLQPTRLSLSCHTSDLILLLLPLRLSSQLSRLQELHITLLSSTAPFLTYRLPPLYFTYMPNLKRLSVKSKHPVEVKLMNEQTEVVFSMMVPGEERVMFKFAHEAE